MFLLASILGCDLGRVNEEIARVELYVDGLHVDIADGHFVPNITFGEPLLRSLKTNLPVDVHLMVTNPRNHIKAMIDLKKILCHEYMTSPFPKEMETKNKKQKDGDAPFEKGGQGDLLTTNYQPSTLSSIAFHIETDENSLENLDRIKEAGLRAGIAIKAETAVEALEPVIAEVDYVLLMTIVSGFAGNPFLKESLEKISWIRAKNPRASIIVDGGVNEKTIADVRAAGTDGVVSGSYLFGAENLKEAVAILRRDEGRFAA